MLQYYKSLDQAFLSELARLRSAGEETAPRGLLTTELTDCVFRLERPRARFITHPARRWSLGYAIAELFWHLSASNDLKAIAYYSRLWHNFSDDGRIVVGSCYGYRIFRQDTDGRSLWSRTIDLLRRDSASRQAVLTLFDAHGDLDSGSKDVPCTCVLQFLLRRNRLNLSVYMRSNDLMLGFGYDIFLFTVLQEMLAVTLGVDIGWYQHTTGSLHLYEKDRDLADTILGQSTVTDAPEMAPLRSLDCLPSVLANERALREHPHISATKTFDVPSCWRDMLQVLLLYRLMRDRDFRGAAIVSERLAGTAYYALLSDPLGGPLALRI